MTSFKTFLAEGAARAAHTLKFFEYEAKEHGKCAASVRKQLLDEWGTMSDAIAAAPTNPLSARKRPPLDKVVVDGDKARVGRFGKFVHVSPSILIGSAYTRDQREAYKRQAFEVAGRILRRLADRLNRDQRGAPFVVEQDDSVTGDLRLKFKTGEFTKTIFLVSTEENHRFERIYIRDFLTRQHH